ncbi:hypothetical protein HDU98_008370 [Podochytrium sp. JEL0797]|nr:hypothetical protein HDU98_008370 [Podochytrium sp. JEL0797]
MALDRTSRNILINTPSLWELGLIGEWQLSTLHLLNSVLAAPCLEPAFASVVRLWLPVSDYKSDSDNEAILATILSKCRNLKSVDLSACRVDACRLLQLLHLGPLFTLPSLNEIDLQVDSVETQSSEILALMNFLSKCSDANVVPHAVNFHAQTAHVWVVATVGKWSCVSQVSPNVNVAVGRICAVSA